MQRSQAVGGGRRGQGAERAPAISLSLTFASARVAGLCVGARVRAGRLALLAAAALYKGFRIPGAGFTVRGRNFGQEAKGPGFS